MFQITISPDEIGKLELASFPGEIHVIDTLDEEFGKAIAYLKRQKVIGFDTETRPTFSPDQRSNGTALPVPDQEDGREPAPTVCDHGQSEHRQSRCRHPR